MSGTRCHLEIYVGRSWQPAGSVAVDDPEGGFQSASSFDYDFDYLETHRAALGARDWRAVSSRFELGYHAYRESSWPAFLLDLVPSGAARRTWERVLSLPNIPRSDWPLLLRGAGNPPGNVRVREAVESTSQATASAHPGFAREEVLERAQDFLEYARMHGAAVAGGSGAGGDAPKFLLREDHAGRFHADGALADERTARVWLVKFPRSAHADDRTVLEAEAAYLRVAQRCGLRVGAALQWERDTLFVPRFDRVVEADGHVARHGLESLCSLAGVSAFGVAIPKEKLARAVAAHVDPADRETELRELVFRDVLDLALGNTDNHARNTAVSKPPGGGVVLSPLFDFAPMFLDTQGIARVCRWRGELAGVPDWTIVLDELVELGLPRADTVAWLQERSVLLRELPRVLAEEKVPPGVIGRVLPFIDRTALSLEALR